MSWGTSFNRDLYISRRIFRNMYELDLEIEDLNQLLNDVKSKILMYATINPNLVNNEITNLVDSIFYEIDDLLDIFKSTSIEIDLLLMYKEEIESGKITFDCEKIK